MTRTQKTFGENIESGLTNLGDRIHDAVKEARDNELEHIKSGWISDVEKLKMLKRDLYAAVRGRGDTEYIQNLRSAIATLSNAVETERTYRNSLSYQITGILNSIILLLVLGAGLSFPATWICDDSNNQSSACKVSRAIPTATFKFFTEAK